jgi:hypothetical protein
MPDEQPLHVFLPVSCFSFICPCSSGIWHLDGTARHRFFQKKSEKDWVRCSGFYKSWLESMAIYAWNEENDSANTCLCCGAAE